VVRTRREPCLHRLANSDNDILRSSAAGDPVSRGRSVHVAKNVSDEACHAAPELKPVENVWQYPRSNWLSNRPPLAAKKVARRIERNP
jgi:hypothetical protein